MYTNLHIPNVFLHTFNEMTGIYCQLILGYKAILSEKW